VLAFQPDNLISVIFCSTPKSLPLKAQNITFKNNFYPFGVRDILGKLEEIVFLCLDWLGAGGQRLWKGKKWWVLFGEAFS